MLTSQLEIWHICSHYAIFRGPSSHLFSALKKNLFTHDCKIRMQNSRGRTSILYTATLVAQIATIRPHNASGCLDILGRLYNQWGIRYQDRGQNHPCIDEQKTWLSIRSLIKTRTMKTTNLSGKLNNTKTGSEASPYNTTWWKHPETWPDGRILLDMVVWCLQVVFSVALCQKPNQIYLFLNTV